MTSDFKLTSEPVNEDTVQCLFFSVPPDKKSSWEALCQQINDSIETLSKEYIWNGEEFQVKVPLLDPDEAGHPYLQSTTCFGDNIEDEWFIVHLIFEISKQFKNLIIQIKDNDGDFLLIEAADYLQTWANPENTDNRVFIYNGNIHIIPPEIIALDTKVDFKTALKIIYESPEKTIASTEIEQAILRRIGKYPEKILENRHSAVVNLPSHIATLLILKPSLIAPIVEAYCSHDIIDVKSCKKIDYSDCVTIKVNFTKFLYAKLIHSKLITIVKHYKSQNDMKTILGLKLMCGYQMIMNNASTDIFSSKGYHQYIKNLKKNGYFKNYIEGSKEYKILLEKAKRYFSIIECPISTNLAHNITQLMSSNDFIKTKASIKNQEVSDTQHIIGDNEDWLNINPNQLNSLLMTRYGKTSKLKSNDVVSAQALTTELSSFLKQTSDFEGIESDCNGNEDNHIEFEVDQFSACLEKMLNIINSGVDTVSEDSGSDFDDVDDNTELKTKLQEQFDDSQDCNNIFANIIQSMKEEKALTGPTSNLMRSIGVHKSDILDSDDDVD